MDVETEQLLRVSLRALLTSGQDVDAGLTDLGWGDVLADHPEAFGLLFQEQGRACVASGAVDDVALRSLRTSGYQVPDGTVVGFPLQGRARARVPDARIAVREPGRAGLVTLLVEDGSSRLVTARPESSRRLVGMDADLPLWETQGLLTDLVVLSEGDAAREAWQAAWNASVSGVAAELQGLAETMLEMAVRHVTDRTQYGKALGSFQAVRHVLADALVSVQAAGHARDAALAVQGVEGADSTSRAAWCLGLAAHTTAAKHAMQVCGAMGLTWEHPLHRYVRRGLMLEALLGSASATARQIGADILASQRVPRVPAL